MKNMNKRNQNEIRNHTLTNYLSSMVRENQRQKKLFGEECIDNLEDDEEKDVLTFDAGGGQNGNNTKKSWRVFE